MVFVCTETEEKGVAPAILYVFVCFCLFVCLFVFTVLVLVRLLPRIRLYVPPPQYLGAIVRSVLSLCASNASPFPCPSPMCLCAASWRV